MKKYIILGAMLFNFTHTTVHADSPTIQDSAKGELLSDTSVSILTEYKEKIAKLSELTTREKEDFFKELYLVEGSPYDKIWGVKIDWKDDKILDEKNYKGLNLLGKALMQVRNELK